MDPQHPPGAVEGTAPHHYYPPMNAQVPPSHHSEDEQRDRMSDIEQPSQGPSYAGQGVLDTILSFMDPSGNSSPPKDKYALLEAEHIRTKDEMKKKNAIIEDYERELKRTKGELRHKDHYIDQLHHENQRAKDFINGLQNELNKRCSGFFDEM